MISQQTLFKAEQDQKTIATVKENFRTHLLMALSEARSATLSLEPDLRETLLDDLSRYFHPDNDIRDTFSDAFSDAETDADNRVDEVSEELILERRQHYPAAAE